MAAWLRFERAHALRRHTLSDHRRVYFLAPDWDRLLRGTGLTQRFRVGKFFEDSALSATVGSAPGADLGVSPSRSDIPF
jgi:hypothetical protein